jgi:hypothetical protein
MGIPTKTGGMLVCQGMPPFQKRKKGAEAERRWTAIRDKEHKDERVVVGGK